MAAALRVIQMIITMLKNEKSRNMIITVVIAIVLLVVFVIALFVSIVAVLVSLLSQDFYYPMPNHTFVLSPFDLERVHPKYHTVQPHYGADFPAPEGTEVLASKTGVVYLTFWSNDEGYVMVLQHDEDTYTRYKHLKNYIADVGDEVSAGTPIAYSGNTGVSTGPHLHFEIRINGEYVDPELLLKPWPEGMLGSVLVFVDVWPKTQWSYIRESQINSVVSTFLKST